VPLPQSQQLSLLPCGGCLFALLRQQFAARCLLVVGCAQVAGAGSGSACPHVQVLNVLLTLLSPLPPPMK